MKKKIDSSSFKDVYLLKGLHRDFATGRRSNLRFAVESICLKYMSLNSKGPEPFEYLEYAKSDIQQGGARGAINGLGNVKRAIHLTINNILFAWGLWPAYKKADFPTQLGILRELNAFPTKTLEALNRKRNIVEHEFKTIDLIEVEELIDIAEMFLLISYPFLKNVIIGSFVGIDENENCYEWRLNPETGELYIILIENAKSAIIDIGRVYYAFKDKPIKSYEHKIKISKSNKDEWLKYLDLFVYMTKRDVTQLEKQVFPGSKYFLSTPRHTLYFQLPKQ